jgi:RNA-directed DNA polymerase
VNVVNDETSTDTERRKMSTEWRSTIAEMARSDPRLRFTTLAHRLTPELLTEAYKSLDQNAAPGPDGVLVRDYGEGLEARLATLHEKLRTGQYRASPARRVYIPKPNGKLRPLGIANVEDRVVQKALVMVLEPIYEQDFLDFSYGFRPGRSAKDALEVLRKTVDGGKTKVVFEADIKGFFDNLDHEWLRKFLADRIADGRIHRLVGKILNSGVVEEGKVTRGTKGAPQGGPLSPLLANLCLHYVLDIWFDRRFRRTCKGEAKLVRYADDFVGCFEHPEEAERFGREVVERFTAFGLELVPEKTRLIKFGTKLEERGPGPGSGGCTFDFLGFTHYMRRRPKRGLRTARKPSQKSRQRFVAEVKAWLHKQMHASPWFHRKVLNQKLRGFFEYFNLRHCLRTLKQARYLIERVWFRVLGRRSQKARLTWEKVKRKPWFDLIKPGEREKVPTKAAKPSDVGVKVREPIAPVQLCLFPEPGLRR